MTVIDLFTVKQVSFLTGLTPSQIVAWDHEGFYPSTWASDGRPYGRVYSFRDVVGLRTLAILHNEHKVSSQELRKVGAWLSQRHEAPWASLRFYVAGRHVYFDDTDTAMLTAGKPLGQGAFPFELEAVADQVRRRLEEARQRRADDIGRIVQQRHVVGNAPVLAGTRIPTSAIWNFYEDGYTVEEIIDEYPRLSPEDVQAAIDFEQERRAS